MFCTECGKRLPENAVFCTCGAKQTRPGARMSEAVKRAPEYQPPVRQPQPHVEPYAKHAAPALPRRKPHAGVIFLVIALVITCGAGGYFLFSNNTDNDEISSSRNPTVLALPEGEPNVELPEVSYTYQHKKPEAIIEFTAVDNIFPSNYRTLESLVTFTGYCEYGEMDILIEAEVPGFTQNYKQKVHLGRQVTKLRIVPPLVTGDLDLNSEKMAQLVFSVTEIDTGRLLMQESKNIKLYSKFDMVWWTPEYGDANCDDILAWITPDSPEILKLKRDAIDYLSDISDGVLDMLLGYQDYDYFYDEYNNTWVQAVAIQGAMSDITKVRYNNSSFSIDQEVHQRIKLPGDTLNSRSGLCIETSLVMASALQSAGMRAMLILPPGHAQVAVEAWPDTGDYFLIETTVLPMPKNQEGWESVVEYLTKDEWIGYITGEGVYTYGECYVLDCDIGASLGIRPMSN